VKPVGKKAHITVKGGIRESSGRIVVYTHHEPWPRKKYRVNASGTQAKTGGVRGYNSVAGDTNAKGRREKMLEDMRPNQKGRPRRPKGENEGA